VRDEPSPVDSALDCRDGSVSLHRRKPETYENGHANEKILFRDVTYGPRRSAWYDDTSEIMTNEYAILDIGTKDSRALRDAVDYTHRPSRPSRGHSGGSVQTSSGDSDQWHDAADDLEKQFEEYSINPAPQGDEVRLDDHHQRTPRNGCGYWEQLASQRGAGSKRSTALTLSTLRASTAYRDEGSDSRRSTVDTKASMALQPIRAASPEEFLSMRKDSLYRSEDDSHGSTTSESAWSYSQWSASRHGSVDDDAASISSKDYRAVVRAYRIAYERKRQRQAKTQEGLHWAQPDAPPDPLYHPQLQPPPEEDAIEPTGRSKRKGSSCPSSTSSSDKGSGRKSRQDNTDDDDIPEHVKQLMAHGLVSKTDLRKYRSESRRGSAATIQSEGSSRKKPKKERTGGGGGGLRQLLKKKTHDMAMESPNLMTVSAP
jgi:hypothetical protein